MENASRRFLLFKDKVRKPQKVLSDISSNRLDPNRFEQAGNMTTGELLGRIVGLRQTQSNMKLSSTQTANAEINRLKNNFTSVTPSQSQASPQF